VVARFLIRCLFTMFSEDVGLIPKTSFTGMLRTYSTPELREFLPDALRGLWATMDTGGFSPDLRHPAGGGAHRRGIPVHRLLRSHGVRHRARQHQR
jgi:hypothetical protein